MKCWTFQVNSTAFRESVSQCHAFCAGNARTNGKAGESGIHLAKRAERTEVFFAGSREYFWAGFVMLMIGVEDRYENRASRDIAQNMLGSLFTGTADGIINDVGRQGPPSTVDE